MASAIEAATCDRFGNPVLRLGVDTGLGRALATQEDFQKQLPAFARFKERAASFQLNDAAEASTSIPGAPLWEHSVFVRLQVPFRMKYQLIDLTSMTCQWETLPPE